MSAKGSPHENAYAERLMRTIKEEEVELSEYWDFTDAYSQIGVMTPKSWTHRYCGIDLIRS
jgi:transposase InsO family protein